MARRYARVGPGTRIDTSIGATPQVSGAMRVLYITSQNEPLVCPRPDFPKPPGLGHTVEVARPTAPCNGCAGVPGRTARTPSQVGQFSRNPDSAGEAMSRARESPWRSGRHARARGPEVGGKSRTSFAGHTGCGTRRTRWAEGPQPWPAGCVDASSPRHRSGMADADAGHQVQE